MTPSASGHHRPTALCVRSRRNDLFADEVLSRYAACVLHDAKLACRKARLGTFDFYLAIDLRSNDGPSYLWNNVRAFDRNTPFVLVVARPFEGASAPAFRQGYDATVVDRAPSSSTVIAHIQALLAGAEARALEAVNAEAMAVHHDITERLARLEHRVRLSRQSLARAQEHVLRAHAIRAFLRDGGTKAQFERYWGPTFEDALRDSYPARPTPRAEQGCRGRPRGSKRRASRRAG